MSDKLFGIELEYLTVDEATKPFGWLDQVTNTIEKQVLELRELGFEITRLQVVDAETPVRLWVKFPTDKPQWEVRRELEKRGYDVGQKLGEKALSFYVVKRTTQTKGWAD